MSDENNETTPDVVQNAPIRKKKPRGFAGEIFNQLKPLNSSDFFKESHGNDNFSIFLVASDDSHAALVHVQNGVINVEDIKNKKEDLKQIKYNGQIIATFETFLAFAMGKVSPIKAVLKRQLRNQRDSYRVKFCEFL